MRPFPTTPQELKDDAIERDYKPGTLAIQMFHDPHPVLITSWPWFEGEGDDQETLIMARTDPNDPSTNKPIRYFMLYKKVGEQEL